MKFELKLRKRNIPKEELIADLKRVAAKFENEGLTRQNYDEQGRHGATTILRRFGTWNNALLESELLLNNRINIPFEELFENLAEVWRSLGRQPVGNDIKKGHRSKFALGTYEKRFGSWNGALQSFIDYIESVSSEITEPLSAVEKKTSASRTNRQINWRLRASILIRDNCICKMCGASPAKNPEVVLHVDHILPYSKGGETVEDNLRTLCEVCNIGRSNHFTE